MSSVRFRYPAPEYKYVVYSTLKMDANNTYEFKVRILGNEIFAIGLTSSASSNRWTTIGLLSTFAVLTLLGAYGDKMVEAYKWISA